MAAGGIDVAGVITTSQRYLTATPVAPHHAAFIGRERAGTMFAALTAWAPSARHPQPTILPAALLCLSLSHTHTHTHTQAHTHTHTISHSTEMQIRSHNSTSLSF